ncbi:MAG: sensor histidine kinase [Coriobacteriales bacterium]
METALLGVRYLCSLVFGVALSAAFTGVEPSRRNVALLSAFAALDFCLQSALGLAGGVDAAKMLYPLITHAPLVVVLVLLLKRRPLHAVAAVLLSYLCCEIPNIVERLCHELWGPGLPVETAVYAVMAALAGVLIVRFASRPVCELFNTSTAVCLSFSSVPAIFYLWDYTAGVYTNWMIANSYEALLTVSGMFSLFFVVFAGVYGQMLTRRAEEEQDRRWASLQLQQSRKELESIKVMNQLTAAFRHDMRHRLVLLAQNAEEGDLESIRGFVAESIDELESLAPVRYCANADVNVLLSYYAQLAEREGVELKLDVAVPAELGVSSSELCSLIGNSFENALEACRALRTRSEARAGEGAAEAAAEAGGERPVIKASLKEHRGYLLLSVENSCAGPVAIVDGLPCRSNGEHGMGAWSIRFVAERRGGQAQFSSRGNRFLLRVAIPLT